MKVIAKPDTQCPMEGKPREYITDSKAVEVLETAYYKRLVDDGSLIDVGAGLKPAPTEAQGNSRKEVKANGK